MKYFFSKLFEPVLLTKWRSFLVMVESFFASLLFDIIPIFAIPYMAKLLEEGNRSAISDFLIYLTIFYILGWTLNYFIRSWDFRARSFVEEGTHVELNMKKGLYYKMLKMQSADIHL